MCVQICAGIATATQDPALEERRVVEWGKGAEKEKEGAV